MTDTPSISNDGEYLSAHYLAEVLPGILRKGRVPEWQKAEKSHPGRTIDGLPVSPRAGLRDLRRDYFAAKTRILELSLGTPEYTKAVHELHLRILTALGFRAAPVDLETVHSEHTNSVPVLHHEPGIVAIEGGWASDPDASLDPAGAGQLPNPVTVRASGGKEEISDLRKLVQYLFGIEDRPAYILILTGGVITLADRAVWGEGRRLSISLELLFGRNDPTEIDLVAHLLNAETLRPPTAGGSPALTGIIDGSRKHAFGVSAELREGLRTSVELVANEVLTRLREQGLKAEQTDDPKALAARLRKESLRYLYRILFLLYAEARSELGVLPVDAPEYTAGYGMGRLGDIVARPLGPNSSKGFHLYESLDLLVRLVDKGHDGVAGGSGIGLTFEALRSELFLPESIALIGPKAIDPDYAWDDPDAPKYDTRLRDGCLYTVLRKLMLASGARKGRGGFISYAQLGINQLGAVYEGLMSYTGTIANEELLEVAKNGAKDGDKDGSWLIPATKADQYPETAFVMDTNPETSLRNHRRHETGSFVFRLAGRDRATSASYYTPESLTRTVVQLTIQERLDQDGVITPARELLNWTICEPALGSGAFLNEAINQVAAEYLRRRESERVASGEILDPIPDEDFRTQLQQVKAYIALHNCYGVDLNETAVELAEVSVWLNVMHKGLQAPWLGLHLRRGDSLIGCTRTTYTTQQVTEATWANETPQRLPLTERDLPKGQVHQFLLPSSGWGVAATTKEAKQFDTERAKQMSTWRRTLLRKPKPAEIKRLTALAVRVEQMWELVRARVELSEEQIRRDLPVWGAETRPTTAAIRKREQIRDDLFRVGSPYWRLKTLMDTWCGLWFAPTHLIDSLAFGEDPTMDDEPVTQVSAPSPSPSETIAEPAHTLMATPRAEQEELISDFELTGVEELSLFDSSGFVDEAKKQEADEKGRKAQERADSKTAKAEALRRGTVSTVPLTSLGAWLDFAEALLGVQPKNAKSDDLLQQFASLDDLDAYESSIPARFQCLVSTQIATRFPWLQELEDIAKEHGFFHWDLDFVRPMSAGGFDIQVGNPPWVRPLWAEDLVLAEEEPWFGLVENADRDVWEDRRTRLMQIASTRRAFLAENADVEGQSTWLTHPATNPILRGTQPDLYRAFMCRIWDNQNLPGTSGLLHRDTHFIGAKEGRLRAASYQHLRIHAALVNVSNRFFDPPISRTLDFGVHIYGSSREVDFLDLCWIFSSQTLLESIDAYQLGSAADPSIIPGVKHEGVWDLRPHPRRVIRVTPPKLRQWQEVLSEDGDPAAARMLKMVTSYEEAVLTTLANFPERLSSLTPQISSGFHESGSQKSGPQHSALIRWNPSDPGDWSEVILKGPQIGVSTPIFKSPLDSDGSRPMDLTSLPVNYVAGTPYRRACDRQIFDRVQDQWIDSEGSSVKYTSFYRSAWRKQIPNNTDRSLFVTHLPPDVNHIDGIYSAWCGSNRQTALLTGFWSGLPIDYYLRIMGKANLHPSDAGQMPAPNADHPLADDLLLRTLRMNCLTTAWAPLWDELYRPSWSTDSWACKWPGLPRLQSCGPYWHRETPLRTDRERRAALVEVDALVAVWLGLTADQLVAVYLSRFPQLNRYEDAMWFDANSRRLCADHPQYGAGQTKEHWNQLQSHLDDPVHNPPPPGFPPPFYKADRVTEMRQAHTVFSARLAARTGAPPKGELTPSSIGPAEVIT